MSFSSIYSSALRSETVVPVLLFIRVFFCYILIAYRLILFYYMGAYTDLRALLKPFLPYMSYKAPKE